MPDLRNPFVPAHIGKHYPDAIRASTLLTGFLAYAAIMYQKLPHKIAFATSVCSDEVNALEQPDLHGMIGPFFMGGLDGSPFVGLTGLGAFLHHIPDEGIALLVFGPHVGITTKTQVAGKIVRRGQEKESSCCGALAKAIGNVISGNLTPADWPDYQQGTLEQILVPHRSELSTEADESKRFLLASEYVFRDSKRRIDELLHRTMDAGGMEYPLIVVGGAVINQDGKEPSYFSIKSYDKFDGHDQIDELQSFESFSRSIMLDVEKAL
jgi:hypothetical protein